MAITMEKVKELRERTGAGVLDCKKALTENDGDVEAAVNYLREKGIADAAKKAGRVASEGRVNILMTDDKKTGIITEINSETDFVAKNDNFKELVNKISEHILQSKAEDLDSILSEPWYKNKDKDVNTIIKEAIASIGENINLRRFQKLTTDGFLQGYTHMGGKIGVLVDLKGESSEDNIKMAKNIAMHIAASSPEYISRDDVTEKAVNSERKIYREQMLNEGKPENIIDKIVDGKMEKYYSKVCLLEQPYVRDDDKSVGDLLKESELDVNNFVRYELGEGIETEEEDFASEVQAEMEK